MRNLHLHILVHVNSHARTRQFLKVDTAEPKDPPESSIDIHM